MKKNLINLLLVTLVLASCKKNAPDAPKTANNNPPAVENPQGGGLGEIPNAGFENWLSKNGQEIPQGWYSIFYMLDTWWGISKTTDKHSGNYAVLLETTKGIFSGTIMSGETTYSLIPKFACAYRPVSLDFYYKYIPSGEDIAQINIELTKWNPTTKKSEYVGGTKLDIAATSSYTQGSMPIKYDTQNMPDSASISLSSSKKVRHPPVGSKLYIDDLAFSK